MVVTVFLAVLIIALALGNILLSFLKPDNGEGQPGAAQPGKTHPNKSLISSDSRFELAAEKERSQMLKKRIDRLEAILLKINGSNFLGKKIDGTVLGQKLQNLSEFKDTTKLEIAALKQDLARVKLQAGIKEKPKKPDYPISDKKLHSLVFSTGAQKN